ncbi:MAG: TonB-dependent receptor [Caldimonas sp.]
MPTPSSWPRRAVAIATLLLSAPAIAEDAPPRPAASASLAPVVVTATRTEASPFDIPASIDRIGSETIRDGRAQVNISESLGGVPGLLARDRQNYAQDVQISVRGFGARSTFGIRGVRLYVDGIPATFPDGQGQISNVDLGSADRIEVLRGPFSALYGNSSGGVIQVFSEDPAPRPTVDFSLAGGSDGVVRLGAKASGNAAGLGYVVAASHFRTDGYRDHSAAERTIGNAKLKFGNDLGGSMTVVVNSLNLPRAQDPLGLTRAQFEADPRGVDASALLFDTRKNVDQTQVGVIYDQRIDNANSLRALVYTGHRNTTQFQSIPVAAQGSPLHPGGVIVLSSDYRGADLRWTNRGRIADRAYTVVAGLAYDVLEQHRVGYQNFIGPRLGVQGALRRDELDTASDFDTYLQATLQLSSRWSLAAGVRRSHVRFDSADHYVVGANGDDSGAARYAATLPVVGAMFAVNEQVHLYATAGRGFETPTFNELAYSPNGATGLNFALQPARSDNLEVGVKSLSSDLGDATLALFETRTENEIVTLTNSGGRSTFQNAGATRRRGVEAAWSATYLQNLRAQIALTYLDAIYRDSFLTCSGTPCLAANRQRVPSGNRIPGVARGTAYASLGWSPLAGWRGAVEVRRTSGVPVNDANSDAAAGATLVGANVGYLARVGAWQLTGFVRGDNLFARRYAGSVIVNEGNGRYFEPAPGRTWLIGTSASYAF